MNIKRYTPAFADHIILNLLCKHSTPEEVLKQILKCGYDHNDLSSNFFSYDKESDKCMSKSQLPHPFVTACENVNVPVVKLFLLLGMRRNAQIMENRKSPLEVFKDTPKLRLILEDDTPWLDRRFPKELAEIMKGRLEARIMKKGFITMMIYGLQGLKITDAGFVFTRQFQDYPVLVQAFVYRMLMSSRQRKAIANKIAKICGGKCVPPVLQKAVESDNDEHVEKRKKCIDSVVLLPLEYEKKIIHSLFSEEERISLLREITENYNAFQTDKALWMLKEDLIDEIFRGICGFP